MNQQLCSTLPPRMSCRSSTKANIHMARPRPCYLPQRMIVAVHGGWLSTVETSVAMIIHEYASIPHTKCRTHTRLATPAKQSRA